MIKIITSQYHNELLSTTKDLTNQIKELVEHRDQEFEVLGSIINNHKAECSRLEEELKAAKDQVSQLQKAYASADENSVTLRVSDDLTKVVPIVRFKPSTFDKFAELGYLKDEQEGNTFAAQLALLTVVQEALGQILESFTEEVD